MLKIKGNGREYWSAEITESNINETIIFTIERIQAIPDGEYWYLFIYI